MENTQNVVCEKDESENIEEFDNPNSEEKFLEWYIDMIERYPNTFVHYLAKDALLQWFGRSIKGPERILSFIRERMHGTKHILNFNMIGDKDKNSLIQNTKSQYPNECSQGSSANAVQQRTLQDRNTSLEEPDYLACGDGPEVSKLMPHIELGQRDDSKPEKRVRLAKIFETDGTLEFSRPHYKCGISEVRCERPCSLKIAYSGDLSQPNEFYIQLIIYKENTTCKRNLLPEFIKCEEENNEEVQN